MGRYERFRAGVIAFAAPFFRGQGLNLPTQVRGEMVPEVHYPREALTSAAPNMGHDTDSYSSDWALFVDYWSRALYTALSGRLVRGDVDVVGGHAHDNYRDDIEWREFGRALPLGDSQGLAGPVESLTLAYVANLAQRDVITLMCHVPEQFNSADLFVRIAQPAPGAAAPDGPLNLATEFYDLNDSPATVVATLGNPTIDSVAAGVQFGNHWLGPITVPLKSCVVVRGQRWVAIKVAAKIGLITSRSGIWEVRLGKVRR